MLTRMLVIAALLVCVICSAGAGDPPYKPKWHQMYSVILSGNTTVSQTFHINKGYENDWCITWRVEPSCNWASGWLDRGGREVRIFKGAGGAKGEFWPRKVGEFFINSIISGREDQGASVSMTVWVRW